ncbi:MAG: NUDIX hydrolase, partial [Candidatus Liptonbacteria bacterium]|nr:NUDIX hydrolase [Candidatus Liptonbacteria bacterium]
TAYGTKHVFPEYNATHILCNLRLRRNLIQGVHASHGNEAVPTDLDYPYWKYGLPDGVVVVPFDTGEKIIAIREWLPGPNATYLKLIGETMRAGEDALTAAKRGLREETGYISNHWELLSSILENSGKSDRLIHIVLAQNCTRISDEEEGIEVTVLPPAEFWKCLTEYLAPSMGSAIRGGGNTLKGAALAFAHLGLWKF